MYTSIKIKKRELTKTSNKKNHHQDDQLGKSAVTYLLVNRLFDVQFLKLKKEPKHNNMDQSNKLINFT